MERPLINNYLAIACFINARWVFATASSYRQSRPGGRHSEEEFFRKASLLAEDKEFTIFPFIRVKKEFNWSVVFSCYETTGYEIDSNILVQVFTREAWTGSELQYG